jgi:hypothetical protein
VLSQRDISLKVALFVNHRVSKSGADGLVISSENGDPQNMKNLRVCKDLELEMRLKYDNTGM